MSCPITVRLGVYALGAADAAERVLVESHLDTCETCRVELASLKSLPGLLASVPANLLRPDLPHASEPGHAPVTRITRARNTRARNTRARNTLAPAASWRNVAGLAAAAALGAAGGFWLAPQEASQPAATSPPAAITLSGANPVTHVRVTVTLTGTTWGTSIRLLAQGLPLNQSCRLIVRSRNGATEIAGTWDAWTSGPVSIPASAEWRPADISSLQVATTSRNLVTVSAVRTGARVRPPSPPKG